MKYLNTATRVLFLSAFVSTALLAKSFVKSPDSNAVEFDTLVHESGKTVKKSGADLKSHTFRTLLNNEFVVVKFYADWCGPCQRLKSTYDRVANSLKNTPVKFVEINIDRYPELRKQERIKTIPRFVYYKKGKRVHDHGGDKTTESSIKQNIHRLFGINV